MPHILQQYQKVSLILLKINFLNASAFFTQRANQSALLRRIRGRFLQLHPPRLAYRSVNNPD